MKRSLYQCSNSVVKGADILCCQGHPLGQRSPVVHLRKLIRGEELCVAACAACPDFDSMGAMPAKKDRGWKPSPYEVELCKTP